MVQRSEAPTAGGTITVYDKVKGFYTPNATEVKGFYTPNAITVVVGVVVVPLTPSRARTFARIHKNTKRIEKI